MVLMYSRYRRLRLSQAVKDGVVFLGKRWQAGNVMLVVLKLEIIGDNYYAYKSARDKGEARDIPRMERYADMMGRDRSRPWIARITGLDEKYGFAREFLRGQKDYSQANSTGSRGVYVYFPLKAGIYEVNERLSWKNTRRYFCRVENAEIIEITKDEVVGWLTRNS